MVKESFNLNWDFSFNEKTTQINVPHDYSIIQKRSESEDYNNGFFPGGEGYYVKRFFAPEGWEDKTVLLEFEGIYMNAVVHLNYHLVAKHAYGYTSFFCDLTPYLKAGEENELSVSVLNTAVPNTRWYTGSGIYRDVWLMVGEKIYIEPYGIFVTTPDFSTVNIETQINNQTITGVKATLRAGIIARGDYEITSCESVVDLMPGINKLNQSITMEDAVLWSVDNPYLYKLKTEIIVDDTIIDKSYTTFGVKTISVDVKIGFLLNDEPIKLKGGNVHHECGIVGAAAYERAEERKVELLKESGYNAIRCAHNPPSSAFLDACDRLGMLVINEAFDVWLEPKMTYDYNIYFPYCWQQDMASMVLRDRNHPSIIMWSTGNEIIEWDGRSKGDERACELADFVRALDNTRPITNAIGEVWWYEVAVSEEHFKRLDAMITDEMRNTPDCDYWAILGEGFTKPLDVVGYNYIAERYEKDGELYPDRVIAGTESFPCEVFDIWELVNKLPYLIGDFVWTAIDYFGESGLGRVWYETEETGEKTYPTHVAYCGDFDVCGFKRPQSYYRDFVWGLREVPYILVHKPQYYGQPPKQFHKWAWADALSSWTWSGFEDKPIEIDVYSAGDRVELFLNGESLGSKDAGRQVKYITKFETKYKPGTLVAVSYRDNVEISRTELKTAGEPARIKLTPDRLDLTDRYGDLSYITVELLDADGNLSAQADHELLFSVYGVGSLLAVGNGNPKSEEMYVGASRRAFEGKGMVVVKTNGGKGKIVLTAMSQGISSASVELSVD